MGEKAKQDGSLAASLAKTASEPQCAWDANIEQVRQEARAAVVRASNDGTLADSFAKTTDKKEIQQVRDVAVCNVEDVKARGRSALEAALGDDQEECEEDFDIES